MTCWAGKTAITPVVERAPTSAAPSVTAAQVSRPIGSATKFCFGIFGNCLRTSGNCAALVMIKIFFAGTSGSTRSTASCKKDFLPSNASNCLGIFSRLNGQKRSPRPPAMMMTKRSLRSVFAFIAPIQHGQNVKSKICFQFHPIETKKRPRQEPGSVRELKNLAVLSGFTTTQRQQTADRTQSGQRQRGRLGNGSDADMGVIHRNTSAIAIHNESQSVASVYSAHASKTNRTHVNRNCAEENSAAGQLGAIQCYFISGVLRIVGVVLVDKRAKLQVSRI